MKRALAALSLSTALVLGAGSGALAGDDPFEQVVDVSPGARLEIEHTVGSIYVRAWDQDRVSVAADHGRYTEVELRRSGNVIRVSTDGQRRAAGMTDFEIRVPAWMPIEIEASFCDVEIEGVVADVDVEVVGGDIFLSGGRDRVNLRSVQGKVELEKAQAEIHLESTNDDVTLTECSGRITTESINGSIRMESVTSSFVEGITMNGDILYDGSMLDDGDYYFSTHNGDVELSVPESANLSVNIATHEGEFRCDFPVELVDSRRGQRLKFVLGAGSGKLRAESFQGDIHLYDPKRGREKRGR